MFSKLVILTLALLFSFAITLSVADDPNWLTEDEQVMIEDTIEYFTNQQDVLTIVKELREKILKLDPKYKDMATKLHLMDDQKMSLSEVMGLMNYFTSILDGNLCYIKQDLKKKDITFTADDIKNVGNVVVAEVKEKMPEMTKEREAQWDAVLVKVVAEYQKIQDGKTPCPDKA